MGDLGVVTFSFGLRRADQEPNPCNVRLARITERVLDEVTGPVVLVSQWEVARALREDAVAHVVQRTADGAYLDTAQVWAQAAPVLSQAGVRRVIAVAQPLLHRSKAHRLIRRDGFEPVRHRLAWVGFDSSPRNTQWWTRGPLRLLVYALLQSITGRAGR